MSSEKYWTKRRGWRFADTGQPAKLDDVRLVDPDVVDLALALDRVRRNKGQTKVEDSWAIPIMKEISDVRGGVTLPAGGSPVISTQPPKLPSRRDTSFPPPTKKTRKSE